MSYANSHKNRYRYRLEGSALGWNEVDSTQRLVMYTNLDHGRYVFRVQGSNSDGVWNEAGVSLPIVITPPWYKTNLFRASSVGLFLALMWVAYQARMRQVQHAFEMTLDARVGERTRIARELHDTLLQGFHGLLLRFQTASYLLPDRPAEAKEKLDGAIAHAAKAITEGRDAVQGLRASTVERNDLAVAIRTLGDELATDAIAAPPPAFRVAVEGQPRDLHPILRDEIYKIAAEALRNAFRHAQAGLVEAEIRYDEDEFRLRVRDDGKGIDPSGTRRPGSRGTLRTARDAGTRRSDWGEAGRLERSGRRHRGRAAPSCRHCLRDIREALVVVAAVCCQGAGRRRRGRVMTSSTPIRILTVDDHPVVREGIAGLVGVQPDMTVIAEAANGRDAIQQFRDAPSGRDADGHSDAGDEWPRRAHRHSSASFRTQKSSC